MVYQPASWFSTSDTVPRGDWQRSSWPLSLAALPPAAAPVATVLDSALPIFMLVVSQPVSAITAQAAASRGLVFRCMEELLRLLCHGSAKLGPEPARKGQNINALP